MKPQQPLRSVPAVFLVILVINILVFVVQMFKGVDPISPDTQQIIGWGANVAPLTLTGEPWRLLTSMFLHIGLLHLAVNSYMLVMLGSVVEREFGSIRFTLIYMLSGLFGSLASALWYASFKVRTGDPMLGQTVTEHLKLVVSAGASGALMGIAGACLAHSLISYLRDEEGEAVSLTGPLFQTIGINLVLGAITPGVDNACHIGGLIAGAVIGGLFSVTRFDNSVLKRSLASAVVCIGGLAMIYPSMNREPSKELAELKQQLLAEMSGKPLVDPAQVDAAAAETGEVVEEAAAVEPPEYERIDLGGQHKSGLISMDGMALSADGRHIYVASEMDSTLNVYDVATRKLVHTIKGPARNPLAGKCNTQDCIGQGEVVLSADGTMAYATAMAKDAVTVIDLNSKKVIRSIPTGADSFPRPLAIDGAGKRAYVLNYFDDAIATLNLETLAMMGKPKAMGGERTRNRLASIWLVNGDKEVWTADKGAQRLLMLNAETMEEIASIPSGMQGGFLEAGFVEKLGTAWFLHERSLDQIDIASKKVASSTKLCKTIDFAAMTINDDGSMMAVATDKPKAVRVIDLRTRKTVGMYPVAGYVAALMFARDGKQIYVMSHNDEEITSGPIKKYLTFVDVDKSIDFAQQVAEDGDFLVQENKPDQPCF